MASGTLYTFKDNFRTVKILVAAQYSGAKLKVASEPPEFIPGETNKTEDFLKKFPQGKVPAFVGNDGTLLFKSNAIAYYVANDVLRGNSVVDRAYIQQWVDFAETDILPAHCTWLFPCLGYMQYNKQHTEKAKEDIKLVLGILNQHLETRTYLVGERITLADISVVAYLLQLYKLVLEPEFRKPFVNTNRWFTTLINQPEFKAVIGEVVLCEKMAQFCAKKYEEVQAATKNVKKQEKPKKEKAAEKHAHEKPKEEPKPAAPVTNNADPEDEEDEFGEKPTKDPFAHLPKGTLNMEDFKRVYSNNDTKTVALPYFWKNFDKENYSIWYSEYKYPEDLKLIFMSCNLVTGMFQRLDRMRKHAFGSVIVFGEDSNSTISGVWFWKGHDLAFTLADDLQIDYESYSWKKLDPNTEETKTLVEEYLSWEGNFGGKKVNQGKIFK